ncbi:glycoside hydrolase family 5 protein [Parvularcula sp. LCG005]|uniref:glycoside hydrolase family 5 protein n=1 Tax=Parvularcula sp. LCG005 TaxID=3078805 RepID=UPI0029435BE5|nr:glycoside hydrolase family 5 protein [Parvularcula sp. LCG005]WOI53455.1 glycoside hydrolase family 5 protein [Parvularcula sp. LCG005]
MMRHVLFPRRLVPAALSLGAMVFSSSAWADGFHTRGRTLLDGNGEPFIMRGINHAHAWQRERTETVLPQIADTGANIVRIALSHGHPWGPTPKSEVRRLLRQAKAEGMILMLEIHNTTGYGENEWGVAIPEVMPYWLSLAPLLKGQEDFVLINIGNEPVGNGVSPAVYEEMHAEAIRDLRRAGLTHTIVVDGSGWGQDHDRTMVDAAPRLAAADPLNNVVFSVHMYQVYGDADAVRSYFEDFAALDLPLIVGEFGADHQGEPVDEEAIFRLSNQMDVGYIGWSWSGNGKGVEDLDIVLDFDPDRLSPWGQRLINGPGGIAETARPATVFPVPTDKRVQRGALRVKGSPSIRARFPRH